MIELFNRSQDGLSTKIEFDVAKKEDGVWVEFVRSERSNYNKWKNPNVLTDKIIQRYLLHDAFSNTDPDGEITKKYIQTNFSKDTRVVGEIEKLSKHVDCVEISLPTSIHAINTRSPRGYRDTFLPLIVKINGVNQKLTKIASQTSALATYAEVISTIDFTSIGMQEVVVDIYVDGPENDPVRTVFNLIIESNITINLNKKFFIVRPIERSSR